MLTITNPEIIEFYKKYNLDFETINLLFLNIFKKIINNVDISLDSNLAMRLLENLSSLTNKVENISNDVSKIHQDNASLLSIKFNEYRKEYIDDLKLILNSNNIEHIAPLIRETNNNLIDKTSLIISDLLPRNQEYLSKDINSNFKLLQSSLLNETTKLLHSSLDKNTIEEFIANINSQMSQTHNTLTTLISSSETRIENKLRENERNITEMKQTLNENQFASQILQNNVSEMLKKFEKGSGKGNISEHVIYNILLSLFPCSQIEHVGNEQKETGDIILIRTNKPKILIENKDHTSKNVPKQEVEKFIRDCEIQNCCGIMFAQHRGITNKQNFELQINNNNVLLYIHETNFDVDKIKTAIEIVENFKMKLDEITDSDNNIDIIEKDILYEINKEYLSYVNQKNTLIKLVKDFNEKMNYSINELKMPSLEKYLSSRFAFSTNQLDNVCKYCEKFIPKSLLQHYRYCSAKKEYDIKNGIETNSNVEICITTTELITDQMNNKKTKVKK